MSARSKLSKLRTALLKFATIDRSIDEIKFNQGLVLAELQSSKSSADLSAYEFKVFSQWGEDGIIQKLIGEIDIPNKTFIEFGVEDFSEANCRFLLMKDIWHGFVIDGSDRNIRRLKASHTYWRYALQARSAFITRENVHDLLLESGFDLELGLLSVDIDGVDYHVLEALGAWRPRLIIVEYNAVFGRSAPVSVPYDAAFTRSSAHYSGLFYGASLAAFDHLLSGRGYDLIGVNSVGSNAFFVRRDVRPRGRPARSVDECFRSSCFREGRDESGRLSFVSGAERRVVIADLSVVDVRTGQRILVRDLPD